MTKCQWCEEEVPAADAEEGSELHTECAFRAVVGGLNHLRGRCSCCGGDQLPDPPELTKREAARAALDYWVQRERAMREAAREVCHAFGLPWIDPLTGEHHPPPGAPGSRLH